MKSPGPFQKTTSQHVGLRAHKAHVEKHSLGSLNDRASVRVGVRVRVGLELGFVLELGFALHAHSKQNALLVLSAVPAHNPLNALFALSALHARSTL